MFKFLIFFLFIIGIYSLSCQNENEFSASYNQIVSNSILTKEVCHACIAHCLICNYQNFCESCEDGYYLYYTQSQSYCKSNLTINYGCIIYQSYNGNEFCNTCHSDYWQNKSSCVKKSSEFIQKCQLWLTAQISGVAKETCLQAKSGYGLINSGEGFIACKENCAACTQAQCTACADNYHLSDDLQSCIKNEGICKVWSNQTIEKCHECPTGYNTQAIFCYNDQCKCESGKGPQFPNCSITCSSNCKTCTDTNTCTKCKDGYYLVGGKCSNSCKDNCISCASSTDCIECKNNYRLNSEGSVCEKCDNINCVKCANSVNICTQCDNTTMLKDGACTVPNPNHCKSMVDAACTGCHSGYYFADSSCTQCNIANCEDCSSSTSCTQCSYGYILYNDGVNPPKCISCTNNQNNYAKYQGTCGNGKWIKFPWNCTDFVNNCIQSETTIDIGVDTQFCQQCKSGYRVKNKSCVKCTISNCINCDTDENDCNACKTGYFKDTTGASTLCNQCTQNCNQCESQSVCLDCSYGYVFTSDLSQCVLCNSSINNCEKCWKADTCLECRKGYYLKDNTCVQCSSNCTDCYDDTHCLECSEFYYFEEEFLCRKCLNNCQLCNNGLTCTTCKENYVLTIDKKQCMYLDACKTDNINCKTCNTTDTAKCVACKDYYYWETTICKSCLDNCLSCTDGKTCKECKEGYDLNSDKTQCNKESNLEIACFSVIEGCIKCNSEHLSRCSYCKQGSVPNDQGTCSCGDGSQLINGKCAQQSTDNVNFDSIVGTAKIDDLVTYIDKAKSGNDKKNNTEKVLKQLKNQLSSNLTSISGAQAATILIQLAETSTTENGQSYYKEILKQICVQEGLDDNVYYSTLFAADSYYLIIDNEFRQTIYDYGFSNCINNYLKKASPKDISIMKLKNSEFQIKQIEVLTTGNNDQQINFTDTQIVATIDLKAYLLSKSETKSYFMVAQAINHDANPFQFKQNNSVMYESKLMNVKVYSKESSTDTNTPIEIDIEMKGKTFNVTFDFEGTKCGHYDEDKLSWMADGNATKKTCMFNHTSHFVIYQETPTANYAYIIYNQAQVSQNNKWKYKKLMKMKIIFLIGKIQNLKEEK